LSYEGLNEIEDFFGDSKSGLNVKVFVGKSEVSSGLKVRLC